MAKRTTPPTATDDQVRALLDRCHCPVPFHAVRTRFLGNIASPDMRGSPMLVNAALEVTPEDADFRKIVAGVLTSIEAFFLRCIAARQADGTITRSLSAQDLAYHLLGVLMGVRVLARVRPERALLEGVVKPALALLDRTGGEASAR